MTYKKAAIAGIKLVLIGALLVFLGWTVYNSDQFPKLQDCLLHPEKLNWPLIIAGWLLFFLGICINIVRWQILTHTLGLLLTTRDAFRIGLISNFVAQMNMGLGLVGGDTVRAVFLARTNPGKGAEGTTAVLMDRAVGLAALLILGGIGSMFIDTSQLAQAGVPEGESETYLLDIIWVVRAIAVGTIVAAAITTIPGLTKWPIWDWATHIPYVGKVLQRLVNAVRVYHSRYDRLLLAVLISLVVQSMFVLSLHAVTSGMNLQHPSLQTHFCIAPVSFIAGALPIGAFEVVLEGMYQATGLEQGAGAIAAFAYRIGGVVTALVGLVIYLVTRAESAPLMDEAQAEEEAEEELAEEAAGS